MTTLDCSNNIYTLIDTAGNKWESFVKDYIKQLYEEKFNVLRANVSVKFAEIGIKIEEEQLKRNIIMFMIDNHFDNDVNDLIGLVEKPLITQMKLVTNLSEIEGAIRNFYTSMLKEERLRLDLCSYIEFVGPSKGENDEMAQKRYNVTKNMGIMFSFFDTPEMGSILRRAYALLNGINAVRILDALSHLIPVVNLINRVGLKEDTYSFHETEPKFYSLPIILVRMPDTSIKLVYKMSEAERKKYGETVYSVLGVTYSGSELETKQSKMIKEYQDLKGEYDKLQKNLNDEVGRYIKDFIKELSYDDTLVRNEFERNIGELRKVHNEKRVAMGVAPKFAPSKIPVLRGTPVVVPGRPPEFLFTPDITDIEKSIQRRNEGIKNLLAEFQEQKLVQRKAAKDEKLTDKEKMSRVLSELKSTTEKPKLDKFSKLDKIIKDNEESISSILKLFVPVNSFVSSTIDNYRSSLVERYAGFKSKVNFVYSLYDEKVKSLDKEKREFREKYSGLKREIRELRKYIDPYDVGKLGLLDKQIVESKKEGKEFVVLEILLFKLVDESELVGGQEDVDEIFYKYALHSNIILINVKSETIEHFEPHGSVMAYYNAHKVYGALKEFISDVKSISSYKFIHAVNNTIAFDGLGPQALSRDSYCLAWSYFFMFTRLINPDKSFEEVEAMIKGAINPSFLYSDHSKLAPHDELNNKYTALPTCDIRKRIEAFILWTQNVCIAMDKNEKIPDSRTLETYLFQYSRPPMIGGNKMRIYKFKSM
ncbi:MAG: hypothetical protein Hyperionvirus1_129 [Hyperionvirus sp.]|uniref:Uncharacterized protein n=1 Tax=Hyperionvirus sp. TaxID=2487770 RepID=A0A3G5A5L7_9VIRU|nr:MAG: hypothetical protein Hyperionvirus1_129 [Hyperionvirus sp.]